MPSRRSAVLAPHSPSLAKGADSTRLLPGRDRAICKALGTNPTELEKILEKSRQTITRRIEEDKLFGIEEMVRVAKEKLPDDAARSKILSALTAKWFSSVINATRDLMVSRFFTYCVLGIHIPREISTNAAFEGFLREILADETKFVLFICPPGRDHAHISRWLDSFLREKNKTASYAILPCKLVDLTPIHIIAEPWSIRPKLIQLSADTLFVDNSNSQRAIQISDALIDYGLSRRACAEENYGEIVKNLNSSPYDGRVVEAAKFSGGPSEHNDRDLDVDQKD